MLTLFLNSLILQKPYVLIAMVFEELKNLKTKLTFLTHSLNAIYCSQSRPFFPISHGEHVKGKRICEDLSSTFSCQQSTAQIQCVVH